MLSLPLFIGFAAGAKFVARAPWVDCFSFDNNEERATSSLTSFIASESPIALQNVLNNIGPGGEWALGVEAGLVVASPTKTHTTDCQCLSSIYQPLYCSTASKSFLYLYMGLDTVKRRDLAPSTGSSQLLQPLACSNSMKPSHTRSSPRPYPVDNRRGTYNICRFI